MAPLLGLFAFDITGHAPTSTACRAVRPVPARAPYRAFAVRAVAAVDQGQSRCALARSAFRSTARLVAIYTIAAGYAGIAGALLTQTTAFASLDVFSFDRSADLLLVLIIGGTGYLYGGLIGAVVFKLMQDWLANLTPQYWQFWIGLVLVVIVLVGRDRMAGWTAPIRSSSPRSSGA